jgi:hypothetical protein
VRLRWPGWSHGNSQNRDSSEKSRAISRLCRIHWWLDSPQLSVMTRPHPHPRRCSLARTSCSARHAWERGRGRPYLRNRFPVGGHGLPEAAPL